MFFTGSRQIVPMTVAFNAHHVKYLINSVLPHGYITTKNYEIKMLRTYKEKKIRTANNFTTRRGKIVKQFKSALLWIPTAALLLIGFQKMHTIL